MIKINYTPTILVAFLMFFVFSISNAQTLSPTKVKKSIAFSKSKRLADVKPIPPIQRDRSWKNRVIENEVDFLDIFKNQPELKVDPVLQDFQTGSRSEPTVYNNFEGVGNRQGVAPPDTDGEVGPDYYFQMINCSFEIFDKEGNSVYGPADNITLWDGFNGPWSSTNDGDPVVIYDELAGRWLASQFALPNYPNGPFYELVAVSASDDPTGEWYRYAYEFDNMPDYPKLSVWPDGYYLAINQFGPPNLYYVGGGIVALDRDAMINGEEEANMVMFNTGSSNGALLPADFEGETLPPDGQPMTYLCLGNNSLRIWEVSIDWTNIDNSTASYGGVLITEPFSNNNINIYQPGTSQRLATLADRLMFRMPYRNFGDYQDLLVNHTVNAGGGRAGIRWYEIRNYGDGWEIYQQSTYAPDDGENRWMASIDMNDNGDIALGYSVSSSSTYPSIRVAGQTNGAPLGLGILDIDETTIKEGDASQTGVNRWGDYSHLGVDGQDGETFWYTTEYSSGGWNWKTQICSFGFSQEPIADFQADETIIPVGETINFTDETSGIPTEWNWTFAGGTPESSTDENPEGILYNTEGTFDVQLIATNELGTDTIIKEGYITASSTVLPDVDFEVDNDFVCTGEVVDFTDHTTISPIQWLWEFSPATVTFVNGTDETSQNPEVVFDEAGSYSVSLTAWNLNGSSTMTNDDMVKAGGYNPYFKETFEDNGFAAQRWTVENPDNDVTWGLYEIGGTTPGNIAAGVNFSVYYSIGERDRLISPPINLEGMSSAALEFQYAYAKKHVEITDSLIVYASGDCGDTWTRVFAGGDDGSGNFATHELVDDFWPETEDDWCGAGYGASCIGIDLSPWAGQPDVRIAFESYSAFGNPMFIDNIQVSEYLNIPDKVAVDDITVYPNPTSGSFNVQIPENTNIDHIQLVNSVGKVVYQRKIEKSQKSFFIKPYNKFNPGVYFLKCAGDGYDFVKKVIIY